MYFKSSVTSTPPFGVDLRDKRSKTDALLSLPMTDAARVARFSRIWTGVSVEVGMSKYSPWCSNSYKVACKRT